MNSLRFAVILAVLFCIATVAEAAETAVKLALFADGGARAETVADLATARLSKQSSVVLLERADIRRVLVEQNLATAGLFSADSLVKLGQILSCDVFVVIQVAESAGADGQRPATASLTAFDAGTGVRLVDQALDPAQITEVLGETTTSVIALAVRKWQAIGQPNRGRTIALLSVRSVGLNPAMAGVPERLVVQLERALLATPDFTIVERRRLEHINIEASLANDRRANLLASAVLLELDLSPREEKDGFSLRASINTVAGKEVGSFAVAGTGAGLEACAQAFVRALREQLILMWQPPDPLAFVRQLERMAPDRRGEADQHAAEGRRLAAVEKRVEAVAATQAALALAPDKVGHAYQLCAMIEQAVPSWLQANQQAAALAALAQDMDLREGPGDPILHYRGTLPNVSLEMALLNLYRKASQFSPVEQAALEELRRRYRQYAPKSIVPPESLNGWMLQQMLCAASADDWLVQTLQAIQDQKLAWECLIGLDSLFMGHACNPDSHPCDLLYDLGELSPAGKRKLLAFFERQAADSQTLQTRLCGYFSAAQLAAQFPRDIPDAPATFARLVRTAVDLIAAHAGTPQDSNGRAYLEYGRFCSDLPWAKMALYDDPQAMSKLLYSETSRIASALAARKCAPWRIWAGLEGLAYDIRRTCPAAVPPPGTWLRKAYLQLRNDPALAPEEREQEILSLHVTANNLFLPAEVAAIFTFEDGTVATWDEVPAAWWTREELLYAAPEDYAIVGVAPDYETGDCFLLICRHQGPYEQFICRLKIGNTPDTPGGGARVSTLPAVAKTYASLHYRGPENFTGNRGSAAINLVVGPKAVYASEQNTVLAWPLDGGEPWIIRVPPGLGQIGSLAPVGDHLYWGLTGSGGCLARSTWRGEGFEILAASARRETRSPLDNCAAYVIDGLTWDKPRNRIAFITAQALWEMTLQKQEIRCLATYSRHSGFALSRPVVPFSSHELLVQDGGLVYLWELENDRFDALLCDESSTVVLRQARSKPSPFVTPYYFGPNWSWLCAIARVNHTIYYTYECIPKKTWYRLPQFTGAPAHHWELPALEGQSPFYLTARGDQVLACTHKSFWRLTPPASK